MTKTDRIVEALLTLGAREIVPSPSKQYRCFRMVARGDLCADRYWVGRRGALHVGRIVSDSISISADGILLRAALASASEPSAAGRPAGRCHRRWRSRGCRNCRRHRHD